MPIIRGEVRPEPDGTLKMIIYNEQAMKDMARTMGGKEVIKDGKVVCRVIRADFIDGKILWEGETNV